MDQIWLTSPSPAMRLWTGNPKSSWRLNPAAIAWARGMALNEGSWVAIADELSAAHGAGGSGEGRLATVGLRWRSLPIDPGWLIWLMPDRVASEAADVWSSVQDKLALAQEFGSMGLFERDFRTGKGRWDAHMFRLFGFDPACGMPSWHESLARIHADDLDRFTAEHERFTKEPGRHSIRYRVVTPDGAQRDLHAFAEVWLGADGQPALMIGAVFDDTESAGRIRAQEAISAQFANAIRLAQVAVWRVDLEQQRIHLNDVGYGMMGMAPVAGGISLQAVRALAHPEDVASLAQATDDAVASHAVIDLETRYAIGASGYRHLLTRRVAERDEQGRAIGLLGVSLDQTERIAEHDRARSLAQRIEMVTDIAGVGVYSVDLSTAETEWNRQMFRIHGLAETSAAPRFEVLIAEIVHPDDRHEFARRRTLALQSSDARFDDEVRVVHPNGAVRWVEYRSQRDQRGGRTIIFGIALDVTERTLQRATAERSLREKEAARQASAAKLDFLARMSHELRTPLNAVLGFAQLIEHEADTVPFAVQLERVVHIRQAGDELLALVGDVFDRVSGDGPADSSAATSGDVADQLAPAACASPQARAGSALRVLYIEDNPVNVILVEELVAMRANTTLHCAEDGLSGVAWAEARHPDVVLVDMQLPDIDGFEVLRRLRGMRTLDRSAIIALSANGLSEDIALARAAGFDDYWTKPIDFRHFLSGLDDLAAAR